MNFTKTVVPFKYELRMDYRRGDRLIKGINFKDCAYFSINLDHKLDTDYVKKSIFKTGSFLIL